MAIVITCDGDMPKCLNTTTKQRKKALQLAAEYSELDKPSKKKKPRGPRVQGFFSRTVIVALESGKELVVQFRPEPLDVQPFEVAQKALGAVVPTVDELLDEELTRQGIWAYAMPCLPGTTWLEGTSGKGPLARVTAVTTLAQILSKGRDDGDTAAVVEGKLRPHLELIMSSTTPEIRRFHDVASDLNEKLDQLKILPLWVSHFDLNEVNILVDEKCAVSGLVDWELSSPLPFGMGFSRIHTLAGEYSEQKFYMPPSFDAAERGFWDEILAGIPEDVRKLVHDHPNVVQTALHLGCLLDTFQLDDGKIGALNPVAVEALPKFFSYRMPLIRGSAPPYSV